MPFASSLTLEQRIERAQQAIEKLCEGINQKRSKIVKLQRKVKRLRNAAAKQGAARVDQNQAT